MFAEDEILMNQPREKKRRNFFSSAVPLKIRKLFRFVIAVGRSVGRSSIETYY